MEHEIVQFDYYNIMSWFDYITCMVRAESYYYMYCILLILTL